MLSNDTKKVIDDARDTLVGQIPVPMMQCQQITLALSYKFMSDDDQQAVKLGGRPHYFTGDLEGYEWGRIMSLRLDDTQRSELYRAGLNALGEAESLPAVFREIFKDAIVPYGDHRTLALFLSTVNRLEYDDSEKLGDAYEYLLKIAEAQADAGQFRTPRHIINFIVSIINPQKHEVIIDPACGTAGFLVSAYQHILSQHRLPGGGTSLSTPDRARLADNLRGYDISPEMTKLSMANMYLHTQNKDPNVHNYDTLTSTDHWNEYADVMLANPPFMTPKGGIKPHGLFRVPARRAEVLFVDYIASHLNEHGRAGIIVPEGIIFQSQNAYKQLRRFLVDESLIALVSLPGGVFNPYSGVKTSILILDKVLAPKTDSIAFFKVENDGYDLGAQRRPVDKDDLPSVQSEVSEYLGRLKRGEGVENFRSASGVVVEKGRVGEDGEYNLSGERYKEPDTVGYSFPVIRIDEVCTVNPRKSELADLRQDTKVSFVPMSDLGENQIRFRPIQEKPLSDTLNGYTYFADNDVLLARVTPCFENGKAGIAQGLLNGIGFGSSEFVVLRCGEKISPEWMYFSVTHPLFRNWAIRQMTGTGGLQRVPRSVIAEFQIPLPPLEVQRELVAEIDGYQRVIDGARQMVASYRPHIAIDPNWPTAELGTACVVNPPKKEVAELDDVTEVSFVPMADIGENLMFFQPQDSRQLGALGSSYTYFRDDDVLLARVTPCFENGKAGIARQLHSGVGFGSSEFYVLRSQGLTTPEWIYICVAAPEFKAWATPKMTGTGGLQRVPRWAVEQYKIPLPSLETQRAIVAELDEEQAAIDQAKRLAVKMEKRIQDVLARVWES